MAYLTTEMKIISEIRFVCNMHFWSAFSSLKAVDITDNFCGESFNYPVNGAIPLQSTAVAVIADHQITSLSTTVTHSYTVVFAGTADGKLKKVRFVLALFLWL